MTGGRPGPRRVLPSYFLAINARCQASKVSGVTIVAMIPQYASSECPGFRGEPTALIVREAQTSGPELFPQDAVFLLQIVDDIALLLVHPTGERDQDELQRMRQRGHGVQATRGPTPSAVPTKTGLPLQHRSSFGQYALARSAAAALFLNMGLTKKSVLAAQIAGPKLARRSPSIV